MDVHTIFVFNALKFGPKQGNNVPYTNSILIKSLDANLINNNIILSF